MKRSLVYLLTGLVLVAIVFSCKKDDPAAPSVVGTWKFTGYAAAGCTDPADNGTETCSGTLAECGSLVLTATTYTYTPGTGGSGGSAESGAYIISGSTVTITPSGGSADIYTFTVTTTTLTLVKVDATSGCTETTTLTRQ